MTWIAFAYCKDVVLGRVCCLMLLKTFCSFSFTITAILKNSWVNAFCLFVPGKSCKDVIGFVLYLLFVLIVINKSHWWHSFSTVVPSSWAHFCIMTVQFFFSGTIKSMNRTINCSFFDCFVQQLQKENNLMFMFWWFMIYILSTSTFNSIVAKCKNIQLQILLPSKIATT